jgi:hypothetical protein
MSKHTPLQRLALALALSLSAASLVAVAGESSETTDIEVIANGVTEKISIQDLKAGETRQLYSESGTLVTATRTADSLELDIAGDRTSIKLVEPGALDDPEIAALLEAHGAGDGKKHIVRVHRDGHAGGDAKHDAHVDGHRRIVVIKGGEGEVSELDADALVVKTFDDPNAKQVIVKRRLTKPADADAE